MTTENDMGMPEHVDTIERLERGVARDAPPDDLFDRILDQVQPPATVIPFRQRRMRPWISSAGAAALAAAAAVAVTIAVTGNDDGLGDPIREVRVSNARVDGTLAVYQQDDGNRLLVADLDKVPPAQRDQFYEIWISRPGSDVKTASASFAAAAADSAQAAPGTSTRRRSFTFRSWPARARRAAIGAPITPRPMNPILMRRAPRRPAWRPARR